MRMLQDPPSTTGDDEHDMAPWIKVTSRAIRRKTRASLATQTLNLSPPKPALRPSRPVLKPKPPPLPADDFKLAIRPRNGLVLSKVSPMVLSNSIMREAKLRPQEADIKIRVNEQQNILVASTPYQSTASALSKIQKLTIGETTYAIASYGISPDNSCRGVIHSREKEATNEELLEAISAPGYEPLTCRRFGDSDTILITFIGKKVPFLIYVGGVETRCFLYKRTVAYCYVCHQTGHRADVCPYPPDVPTCKDCEALLTAEPHECKPKCALCSGEHRTASKACPGRFLPPVNRRKEQTSIGRRRPRTPSGQRGDPSSRSSAARSRSRSYPRLTQDRRRRSSRSRSRSKTRGRTPSTQERIETQQSTQVSWAQTLSRKARSPPLPNDMLKQVQTQNLRLQEENTTLKAELAALREELCALRNEIKQTTQSPSAPEKRKKIERPTSKPLEPPSQSPTALSPQLTEITQQLATLMQLMQQTNVRLDNLEAQNPSLPGRLSRRDLKPYSRPTPHQEELTCHDGSKTE